MVDLSIWNVKFSGDLSTKSDTQRYVGRFSEIRRLSSKDSAIRIMIKVRSSCCHKGTINALFRE